MAVNKKNPYAWFFLVVFYLFIICRACNYMFFK